MQEDTETNINLKITDVIHTLEYVKLPRNVIISTYKKTKNTIKKRIDFKGKQIMKNIGKGVLKRMNINSKNTSLLP